jgi:hypothetical protein
VPARPPLTTHIPEVYAKLWPVRVQTPWGKGCTYSNERYKPLVEVDLLAHGHPAFRPRPTHYNV